MYKGTEKKRKFFKNATSENQASLKEAQNSQGQKR